MTVDERDKMNKVRQIAGCFEQLATATTGKSFRVVIGKEYKNLSNCYLEIPLYSGLSVDEECKRFLQLVGETEGKPNSKEWACHISKVCGLSYDRIQAKITETYGNLTIAEIAKLINDYKPNP